MNRKTIIIIGIVLIFIIGFAWTTELSSIKVGQYYDYGTISGWRGGISTEEATAKRALVNQRYGIWFILVAAGATVLAFNTSAGIDTSSSKKIEQQVADAAIDRQGLEKEQIQNEMKRLQERLEKLEP